MKKTASQIADKVLEKCAIDLRTIRAAMGRLPKRIRGSLFLNPFTGRATVRSGLKPREIPEVFTLFGGTPKEFSMSYATPLSASSPLIQKMLPGLSLKKIQRMLPSIPRQHAAVFTRGDMPRAIKLQKPPQILQQRLNVLEGKLSPQNREMLNRLGYMHENVEKQVATRASVKKRMGRLWGPGTGVSHLDPEVLLQEHNMLTTLPKRHYPARNWLVEMRNLFDSPALAMMGESIPGFRFGQSARLSRHARREIAKKIREIPLLHPSSGKPLGDKLYRQFLKAQVQHRKK